MPSCRCTVRVCSNISNHSAGISLHRSPASGAVRDQWLRFSHTHRANFALGGIFVVCSEHLTVLRGSFTLMDPSGQSVLMLFRPHGRRDRRSHPPRDRIERYV